MNEILMEGLSVMCVGMGSSENQWFCEFDTGFQNKGRIYVPGRIVWWSSGRYGLSERASGRADQTPQPWER